MEKFIRIDERIISVKDVREIQFVSDDIYLDLIPEEMDYIPFTFAKVRLATREVIDVNIDLYSLDEVAGETKDKWINNNRKAIRIGWGKLFDAIGGTESVVEVNGYEYKNEYELI